MAVVISDRQCHGGDRALQSQPDAHLVGLAQTGNEAAFAAIVRRYGPELLAQARRLTSDGRGEDAVQQAFLNAFAALQAGGEVRHLRGWLHQILRHVVINTRVPVEAPLEAAGDCGEALEDTVQRRATARATLVELGALPPRQREALVGTALHGFPRAHVARTMGVSEGAVRQLVHRARLRLRQAATALAPFPLSRLFGAARSGVDAAPDITIGAGTAASGGLVIKVGTLLASGVVATGLAVTHPLPAHHRIAGWPHVSRDQRGGAAHPVSKAAPAVVGTRSRPPAPSSRVFVSASAPAATRPASRSGRGEGRGQGSGPDSAGRGDGGRPGLSDRAGPGRSTTSGDGHGGGSGSGSSDGGSGSSDGGGGGGSQSGGDGSVSTGGGETSTLSAPAPSGSPSTTGELSGGGSDGSGTGAGTSSSGSDASQEISGGSRDVSGSPGSSSS